MKPYRDTRRRAPKVTPHHNPTNAQGKPTTASPIANLQEIVRRKSLVKLQRNFQALLKRQQRQQRRHARHIAEQDQRQIDLVAKLLDRTALRCQNVATEIAKRMNEKPVPATPRERTTRNTSRHSKVRFIK